MISLGCAKNLVDSQIMAGHLARGGMELTEDQAEAEVMIVNTCSFIDMAKTESIEAIQAAAAQREKRGRERQKLIVAGCLSQRFSKDLPGLMPEVDAFIGLDQVTQVVPVIEGLFTGETERAPKIKRSEYIPDWDTPSIQLTPKHFAYVKIAEGCNHGCTFCIIPGIRGKHRSRTQASVVAEVRALVRSGVKEINLISQDTTYFGMDFWTGDRPTKTSGVDSTRGQSLATLLRDLNEIPGDFWIRVFYTHPAHWSDELIAAFAECDKVVKYIDIPLQHISDNMLKVMRRETDKQWIVDLLARIRAGVPGIAIRTTFIVGHPGETEEDFEDLLEFIEEQQFERAGVFEYSQEEGTVAAKWEDRMVPERTRRRRWNEATALLERLAEQTNEKVLGRRVRVLVDEPGVARTWADAPEIDGTVLVPEDLAVGEFAEVEVHDWRGYDLVANR